MSEYMRTKFSLRSLTCLPVLLPCLALLIIPSAFAATDTWTGTFNFFWDNTNNWSLAAKPAAVDDAVFSAGATFTDIDLTAGETANTLAFHDNYTLEMGTLTLTTGTVTIDSGKAVTISSTLIGAASSLTKSGAGTLVLTGNNTYSGGTALNAGTLQVGSNTALGTGTLTINGGTFGATDTATLANNIVANADFGLLLQNPSFQIHLTLNGTLDLGSGNPRTITLLNPRDDVTFGGKIFNGTGLTLVGMGGGQFDMAGAVDNTYTGTTTFSNILVVLKKPSGFIAVPGDLVLENATVVFQNNNANPIGGSNITATNALLEADTAIALTQNIFINDRLGFTGADSTLSGVISGPGEFRVVTFQSVSLTNNANDYSGGTSLENGTLFADANNALGTGAIDVKAGQINNVVLASHVDGTTLPNSIFMEADLDVAPAASGTRTMTLDGDVDLNAATRTTTPL